MTIRSSQLFVSAFALLAAATLMTAPAHAAGREQIRIVGSSTVFPFTSAAAEQFGQGGKFKTPIVEATGTGGGFKLFCSGEGEATPDINNASRQITDNEKAMCKQNGITKITEVQIGYDGIVLANAKGSPQFTFTKKQLFMALAAKLPKNGALVDNWYRKWSEIDPALPAQPIQVYGPPPTSGTRDAFVELVMEEGCKAFPEFTAAYPNDKDRKKACSTLREDGPYINAGEDDNIIIQKLVSDKSALGIFGYSFMEENRAKVQGSKVDGVGSTMENIENGKYKLARSLYVYVKGEHLGKIPGLAEFVNQLVSDDAIGANGYLAAKGLLPLHDKDRKTAQANAASLNAAK